MDSDSVTLASYKPLISPAHLHIIYALQQPNATARVEVEVGPWVETHWENLQTPHKKASAGRQVQIQNLFAVRRQC